MRLPEWGVERADDQDLRVFRHLINRKFKLHAIHLRPKILLALNWSLDVQEPEHARTGMGIIHIGNDNFLFIVRHVFEGEVIGILVFSTPQRVALASFGWKWWVELEGTIDVTPCTLAEVLNIVVVDRTPFPDILEVVIIKEKVCGYISRLASQFLLEWVLLHLIFLPKKFQIGRFNRGTDVWLIIDSANLPLWRHELIPDFHSFAEASYRLIIVDLFRKLFSTIREVRLVITTFLNIVLVNGRYYKSLVLCGLYCDSSYRQNGGQLHFLQRF